jgi:hypothetical protein
MEKKKKTSWIIPAVILLIVAALILYQIPSIKTRVQWNWIQLRAWVKYTLNPPEEELFVPGSSTQVSAEAVASPTVTEMPTQTPVPTGTLEPSPTPLPTATPFPEKVILEGVRYEHQHGLFSYCAPANLSMGLSYWGWEGNRETTGPILKPNPVDKNVMPYEMENYVETQTGFSAVVRVAGTPEILKQFLANGYVVLVEKGGYENDSYGTRTWMGHYLTVTGYDDAAGTFIVQDSYRDPDTPLAYDEFVRTWRPFNFTYLVIYPPDKESEIMNILGADADEMNAFNRAAQMASEDIFSLSDPLDHYFSWFNRGTSLMELQDYYGAAAAFDEAFAAYSAVSESDRPWRMLWYQTGPYFAYYYTGRYQDVIDLADLTLNAMSVPDLEESYYWRGLAKYAVGNVEGAIEDFRLSLKYHRDFQATLDIVAVLGLEL